MLWWTLQKLKSEKTFEEALRELANAPSLSPRALEPLLSFMRRPLYKRVRSYYAPQPVYKNQDLVARILANVRPPAVEQLVSALADTNRSVRDTAAIALGMIGDVRAVEPLIASFKCGNTVRSAAKALGVIGDPRATETLIAFLENSSLLNSDNATIIEALGLIGGEPAIDSLITFLRIWGNDHRDGDAHEALGRITERALTKLGQATIEPLAVCLTDERAGIRSLAGRALKNLGYDPPNLNAKIAYFIAIEDVHAIIKFGEPAVPALRAYLNQAQHPDVAAAALVGIGGCAINVVIAELDNQNLGTRYAAAEALRRISYKPPDLTSTIAYLAAGRNVSGLLKIGEPAIKGLVLCLLPSDPRSRLAAEALIQIGQEAVGTLIEVLQDRNDQDGNDQDRCIWVAEILGRIGDKRATGALAAC